MVVFLAVQAPADPVAPLGTSELEFASAIAKDMTYAILGTELPLTVVVPIVAAILGGVFAFFNGWVGESLKRMWLRGDRIRLLRAEYLHLEHHYKETLRLWELKGFKFNSSNLRHALYAQDGFLSHDVSGLASLYPDAVRGALFLMGFVRNTNLQVEARAAALTSVTAIISGTERGALKRRLKASLKTVQSIQRTLPPDWASIALWRRWKLLVRLALFVTRRAKAVLAVLGAKPKPASAPEAPEQEPRGIPAL